MRVSDVSAQLVLGQGGWGREARTTRWVVGATHTTYGYSWAAGTFRPNIKGSAAAVHMPLNAAAGRASPPVAPCTVRVVLPTTTLSRYGNASPTRYVATSETAPLVSYDFSCQREPHRVRSSGAWREERGAAGGVREQRSEASSAGCVGSP
jgi:hypothetical protein